MQIATRALPQLYQFRLCSQQTLDLLDHIRFRYVLVVRNSLSVLSEVAKVEETERHALEAEAIGMSTAQQDLVRWV